MSGTFTNDEKIQYALKTALFRTMQTEAYASASEMAAPPRIFPQNIMKVNIIEKGLGDIDENGYYVGGSSDSVYVANQIVPMDAPELTVQNYKIIDPSSSKITNVRINDLASSYSNKTMAQINALPTTGTTYPLQNWFFRGHYSGGTNETAFNNASSAYHGLQLAWDKSTTGSTAGESDIVPHLKYYLQVQTKYTDVKDQGGDNLSYTHAAMVGLIGLDQNFTNTIKVNKGEGHTDKAGTLGSSGTSDGDFWFTQATAGLLSFYGVSGKVNETNALDNLNTTLFPMISFVRYTGETGFGAGSGGGGGSVVLASADSNVENMIAGTPQTMTTPTFSFDAHGTRSTTNLSLLKLASYGTNDCDAFDWAPTSIDFEISNAGGTPLTTTARITALAAPTGGLSHGLAGGEKSSALTFSTEYDGTLEERMRIDQSGNVGIGTTTPTGLLDVKGKLIAGSNNIKLGTFNGDYDFSKVRKIAASDGAEYDQFGYSVDTDGIHAIVGAYGSPNNAHQGKAYIFNIASGNQLHILTASDAADSDEFGHSVAVSGNYAIVGAWGDDDNGGNSGSAYVFNVTTGSQIYKLVPSGPSGTRYFGFNDIAVRGNHAIVGAYRAPDGTDVGCAYVYDLTTGNELHHLVPSDAGGTDFVGHSVAIEGDYAIVGANAQDDNGTSSGCVYVFSVSTGAELRKLTAHDAAEQDHFGEHVAISGKYAIVGARYNDDDGNASGSAYIFDVTTGVEYRKLIGNDTSTDDNFGCDVDICGNYAIVGAKGDDDHGTNSGAAYIFDIRTGEQLHKLTKGHTVAGTRDFGQAVSIGGQYVIAGTHWHKVGIRESVTYDVGAAYIFGPKDYTTNIINIDNDTGRVGMGTTNPTALLDIDGVLKTKKLKIGNNDFVHIDPAIVRIGKNYGFTHRRTHSGAAADDRFGFNVAVSKDYYAVTAPNWDGFVGNGGAIYIYNHEGTQVSRTAGIDIAGSDATGAASKNNLDIHGNYLIVGVAHADDYPNFPGASGYDHGKAYIFDVRTGIQLHRLQQQPVTGSLAFDKLGTSCAIYGNYACVGAHMDRSGTKQGAVFVYDVPTGTQLFKLTASDATNNAEFGFSIAMYENYAVIGAPHDERHAGSKSGAAYVFDITTGTELHILVADDHWSSDFKFGYSVALHKNLAVIGAPHYATGGYAFLYDINTGTQLYSFRGSDTAAGDSFGESVTIYGEYIAVGAPGRDVGSSYNEGAVYIFATEPVDGKIQQVKKLVSNNSGAQYLFGGNVALDDNILIVGADGQSSNKGEAYVYVHENYYTSNKNKDPEYYLNVNNIGVGIGTATPEHKFQVVGQDAYGYYTPDKAFASFVTNEEPSYGRYGMYIGVNVGYGHTWIQTGRTGVDNTLGGTTPSSGFNLLLQPTAGNVGIGIADTGDTGSYKLKVAGNTHCSGSATCHGLYNYGFGYISNSPSGGLGTTSNWNHNGESQLKLIGSNNCMTFRVTTSANSRQALIQVGHESSGFSAYKGSLYLNRWGGGVYYGTSAVSTSDDRIKHNEKEITNALSIINKLKPMHYIKTTKLYDRSHNFNLNSNNVPIGEDGKELIFESDYIYESGLIAQEIQKIPELSFSIRGEETEKVKTQIYKKDNSGNDILDISGNKIIQEEIETVQDTSLSLDYNSIFVTHIAATQELDKKVIALESENQELKNEVATLKSELATIKQHLGI